MMTGRNWRNCVGIISDTFENLAASQHFFLRYFLQSQWDFAYPHLKPCPWCWAWPPAPTFVWCTCCGRQDRSCGWKAGWGSCFCWKGSGNKETAFKDKKRDRKSPEYRTSVRFLALFLRSLLATAIWAMMAAIMTEILGEKEPGHENYT